MGGVFSIVLISNLIYKYQTIDIKSNMRTNTMELSNLSQFMIELKHSGTSEYHGAYKQIPLRLRFVSNARVTALTSMFEGASKNKILNDLIEIALDQVYEKMTDDQKAIYEEIQSFTLADTLKSAESGDEKND
jgi:hypothetical protein